MKMPVRLLSVVLALLLAFPGAAFAEDTSDITNVFDGYSIQQLYALRNVLDTEIASRENNYKEVIVPIGTYVVGIDIPAGTYTVSGNGEDNALSYIEVIGQNGKTSFFSCVSKTEVIGKLELKQGDTVEVLYASVIFSTYKGLGF